jgi:hypothetical protein
MASTVAKDAALLESIDPSSTIDLHRSNLMRMQVTELLEECHLELQTRKWATEAHEYLQSLSNEIPKVSLETKSNSKYQDRADKPVFIKGDDDNNNKGRLSVEPIGCTKTPVGWTKKSGNAQMLPTFTLMLQFPSDMLASKDYLNYRYFDVSFVLSNSNLFEFVGDVYFICPHHCSYLPFHDLFD